MDTTFYDFGINGSLRRKASPDKTEYYLFNGFGNMKSYSDNGEVYGYYGYDDAGQRTYKMTFSVLESQTDEYSSTKTLAADRVCLYPNGYININQGGEYTKHYYAESQRIASKVGSGSKAEIIVRDKNVMIINPDNPDHPGGGQHPVDPKEVILGARYEPIRGAYAPIASSAASRARLMKNVSRVLIPHTDTVNIVYDTVTIEKLAGNGGREDLIYYYHGNHLSSTQTITDGWGYAVQQVLYAPFGEVVKERTQNWSNNVPAYLFNAKELDEESGMYYFEARYMKPPTFISRDVLFESKPFMSPYAYCRNSPIMFVDPTGMEAWEVKNQWNDDYINKFNSFVSNQINQYVKDGSEFTCEDLALSLLIDYASANGLPVTINNGSGTFDARSDNYTDVATFKSDVLTTTGARDLQNNNNTVSADISGAKGGDMIVNRNSNNVGTHIQVVTAGFYIDNTDFVNGVSVAQGNSGLLNGVPGSSVLLGAGNPNSFFYTGKPIERGWIDVNANVYFNQTTGKTINNYRNAKNIDVRRWNFSGF